MNTTNSHRESPSSPPIGFLLRTLDTLIDDRFDRTLGTVGLSRRQWQLLHTLAERPATLEDLDATVAPFLDRASGETVNEHLDPLAAKGIVTTDGSLYQLADPGRRLFDSLYDDVRSIRELTIRGLPDGDYERTITSLQSMVDNLQRA